MPWPINWDGAEGIVTVAGEHHPLIGITGH